MMSPKQIAETLMRIHGGALSCYTEMDFEILTRQVLALRDYQEPEQLELPLGEPNARPRL